MCMDVEMACGSLWDVTIPNTHVFSRAQIQALASIYANGDLFQWGRRGLLEDVLGLEPSHAPAIVPLAWDINELLGHLVCVVDPGSPHAWILRILLAPEFIWLGLHWAGTSEIVSLQDYYQSLLEILRNRPMEAAALLQRALQFDGEWLALRVNLGKHFGGPEVPTPQIPNPPANLTITDTVPRSLPAVLQCSAQALDSEMDVCPVTPTTETSFLALDWSMDWTAKDVSEEGDEIL